MPLFVKCAVNYSSGNCCGIIPAINSGNVNNSEVVEHTGVSCHEPCSDDRINVCSSTSSMSESVDINYPNNSNMSESVNLNNLNNSNMNESADLNNSNMSESADPNNLDQSSMSESVDLNNLNNLSQLKIMVWNVHGLGDKLKDIDFLHYISNYDLIIFLETMKLDTYSPDISGYVYKHFQRKFQHRRSRKPAGGIGVLLLRSNLKLRLI